VGAIVVGGDYQGLGIVRSVGRQGWPVCVLDDERSIARFSRYTTHHVRVPDLRDETATINALLTTGRRLGLEGWVIFPTREEIVACVSRHRDLLGAFYRVPTPVWESVRVAWDKRQTYALAAELGIPTPRTWYPRTVEEVDEIDVAGPFALKPAIKENFVYATGAKAWRADTLDELRLLVSRALDLVGDGEVMVQELIPGDRNSQLAFCAFFKEGQSVGRLTARRLRQHPPEFGRASTYVETVDIPELAELAERFLRGMGYYGLVEVEFKRDARDDVPKLLDVNARTWGYHSIGAAAGVDFPALLMADQLGESVDSFTARPGVRWVRVTTDLPTALIEIAHRRLTVGGYLASMLSADTEAVFTLGDPLPALAELALIPYLMVKRGF
jgi:predicted ATP-grasp superfamily ATP-dependent carboligase